MLARVRAVAAAFTTQVRCAAASEASKDEKPRVRAPSSIPGKAGKRAGEMWEEAYAAEGEAGVTRLEKELAVLTWSVKGDTRWDVETTSPFFSLEWRREQVQRRVNALGLSPLLSEAVMRLVAAGEVRRLAQVRIDYEELMRAHRREVDVQLITAEPVGKDRLALLQKSIQADFLSPEDNLIFSANVDPSLEGGYKVVIKGQEHDFSWARDKQEAEVEFERPAALAIEKAFLHMPRMPAFGAEQAVSELRLDKDFPGVFGPDLFGRSLALIHAREAEIEALLSGEAQGDLDEAEA